MSLEQVFPGPDVLVLLAGVTPDNKGFPNNERLDSIRNNATVVPASRAENA